MLNDANSLNGLDKAKQITQLNADADARWGGLKHNNLSIYIDKAVQIQLDAGIHKCVILVLGIHQGRLEEIQNLLKEKVFYRPVEAIALKIYFLDGGELSAQFTIKRDTEKN